MKWSPTQSAPPHLMRNCWLPSVPFMISGSCSRGGSFASSQTITVCRCYLPCHAAMVGQAAATLGFQNLPSTCGTLKAMIMLPMHSPVLCHSCYSRLLPPTSLAFPLLTTGSGYLASVVDWSAPLVVDCAAFLGLLLLMPQAAPQPVDWAAFAATQRFCPSVQEIRTSDRLTLCTGLLAAIICLICLLPCFATWCRFLSGS